MSKMKDHMMDKLEKNLEDFYNDMSFKCVRCGSIKHSSSNVVNGRAQLKFLCHKCDGGNSNYSWNIF